MRDLTTEEIAAAREVAGELAIPPEWLVALVDFESGWRPAASNPHSSATGLIQFIDSTAVDLGYRTADELVERNPTTVQQLKGPVLQYLRRWAPFPTLASLTMAVFYPAARHWSEDVIFPAAVRRVNPGISTVGDYVRQVSRRLDDARRALGDTLLPGGAGGAAVALLLLGGLALGAGALR